MLVLFTFLLGSPVFADEGWIIDDFQSQIAIQTDGQVTVAETIAVDFNSLVKHGIYRDIPVEYPTDDGTTIYSDLQVREVLQDDKAIPYQTSRDGNFLRLKIGDAGKTISGKHRYRIEYQVTGILRSFEDHDELYYDVTGNGWPVPITQSSAVVTLPGGLLKTACYQGEFGSTTPCTIQSKQPQKVSFVTSGGLKTGEGLTVVVGYQKGLVPILQVSAPPVSTDTSEVFLPDLLVFLATFLLLAGAVVGYWWKKGRETAFHHEAVMVEYSAPEKLRPAEVGTILDERADTLDVSATIIDLATRGFLKIKEVPKKWLLGKMDYLLTRTDKEDQNLLAYEKHLLERIFTDGDEVNLSDLKREFYKDLVDTKEDLYQDIIHKNYFSSNPEKVKTLYRVLGSIGLLAGMAMFIIGVGSSEILGGVGMGLFVGSIILLMFYRAFPKRTPKGHQAYMKILGFKLFIEKAEKYKQQYLEKENIFNELLPYAIVFGVTEKFAKALADLGMKPTAPTWYASSRPFDAYMFSHSINDFSRSVNSAIEAQPVKNSFASSGSGFSGGSSGGGFGGGGGGSW